MRGKGRTKVGIGGSVMRWPESASRALNGPKPRSEPLYPLRNYGMNKLARADGASLPPRGVNLWR